MKYWIWIMTMWLGVTGCNRAQVAPAEDVPVENTSPVVAADEGAGLSDNLDASDMDKARDGISDLKDIRDIDKAKQFFETRVS